MSFNQKIRATKFVCPHCKLIFTCESSLKIHTNSSHKKEIELEENLTDCAFVTNTLFNKVLRE